MKSQLVPLILVCLCAVDPLGRLCASDGSTAIAGVRGVAGHRAVVDVGTLARMETSEFAGPLVEPAANAGIAMAVAAGGAPVEPAPQLTSSFRAFLNAAAPTTPTDTHGAVGLAHVVSTANVRTLVVQDRAGNTLGIVSYTNFWASVVPSVCCDFRILYDPYNDRWIQVGLSDEGPTYSLLLAASQTGDPLGRWNLYRIGAGTDPTLGLLWLDYPLVGYNKDWIVVRAFVLTSSNNQLVRDDIFAFNKTNVYAGGSGEFTRFPGSTSAVMNLHPVTTHDNSISTMYLVGEPPIPTRSVVYGGSDFSGITHVGSLDIYNITGAIGSEVLTKVFSVTTPHDWDRGAPGYAQVLPQRGTTQRILSFISLISGAEYRNGSIWATHNVFLPAGGSPTRTAIQWWQIREDGVLLQQGRIDDSSSSNFYAYPSLAVNRFDDLLIGFSRFSTNQYASANYAFRYGGDPPETTRPDVVIKAGEASYFTRRWGDSSATVVDPANDLDLWTIQQYAAAPATTAGIWWGKVSPGGSNRLVVQPSLAAIEGGDGLTPITYSFRLGEALPQAASIDFMTVNGTAVAEQDYIPADGTISFLPGEIEKSITISLKGDRQSEPDEDFFINLSNPTNVTLVGTRQLRGVIRNDDLIIVTSPSNQLVRLGRSTNFTVVVTNSTGRVHYQWNLNGTDIADATNTTLLITNAQISHEGSYSVTVQDDFTSVQGASATLTVLVPPLITQGPITQAAVVGDTVTFSVAATGHPMPLWFRWRKGGATLLHESSIAPQSFLVVGPVRATDAGTYGVIVTNLASVVGGGGVSANFSLSILADSDGDGLPDLWESQFESTLGSGMNPDADADTDGLTNLQEYRASTDPNNAASVLRLELVPGGEDRISLRFLASSNRTYSVEYSEFDVVRPWARLVDFVAHSTNHLEQLTDPQPAAGRRIYRLRTPRAP